jgi:hypothetical protein
MALSPEQFEKSLEFGLLSPIEKEFVLRFIETRDLALATRAAYPKSRHLNQLQWRMRNNLHVLSALNLWYGRPALDPKTEAIAGLKRDLKHLKGVAKVQARRLLLQLEGVIEK